MNDTPTIEVEVAAPEDARLVKFAGQTGLEPQSTQTLVQAFRPIFTKLREALVDCQGVAASVKDATCVTEIRQSRTCRLALRAVRIESDNARKKHKEHALLYGRAVDGFHNILLADLVPVEKSLQDAEDIAERAEATRKAALKAEREKELGPLQDGPITCDLGDIPAGVYASMLADAKLLRQAKLDAIARAHAEAAAKAEAERIERERITAENARLKAEAEAREAAMKAEREEAERKLAAERAEAARIAAVAKAKAEAEAKAAAEAAAKERAAIEAKAAAEAVKVAQEAARVAAELKAKTDVERAEARARAEIAAMEAVNLKAELAAKARAEAEIKAKANAEEQARLKAARAAATAPDLVKVKMFAKLIRCTQLMDLANFAIQTAIAGHVNNCADRIEEEGRNL